MLCLSTIYLEEKVSLSQCVLLNYACFNLGVYIWYNQNRSRVTFGSDGMPMTFDHRLVFADNDFRVEYRGELDAYAAMHGKGTLSLKDGQSYTGQWAYGTSVEYATEIYKAEQDFLNKAYAEQ